MSRTRLNNRFHSPFWYLSLPLSLFRDLRGVIARGEPASSPRLSFPIIAPTGNASNKNQVESAPDSCVQGQATSPWCMDESQKKFKLHNNVFGSIELMAYNNRYVSIEFYLMMTILYYIIINWSVIRISGVLPWRKTDNICIWNFKSLSCPDSSYIYI